MICVSACFNHYKQILTTLLTTPVVNSKQLPRPINNNRLSDPSGLRAQRARPGTCAQGFAGMGTCAVFPERGSKPGACGGLCAEPGVTRVVAAWLLYIVTIIGPLWAKHERLLDL